MNSKYIYIETYGCSANQNNSEILKGILKQSGYEITNNEKIADILVLNTCIVKEKTESKIKRRIQDLSKEYPKKLLIVSGCMPQTEEKSLKKINPKLIFLGTHHFKEIVKLIRDYNENKLNSKKQEEYLSYKNEEKILLPKISTNKLISIVQISEGCNGECSYCNVRLAKGKLFSYDLDKIIKSIENDLQSGAKEIWLTSQDNASYGLDKDKQQLPELLSKVLSLKHNFKLRIGMMNPNNLYPILNKLIEIYKNKKMYKFLHIPIQSASNKVLIEMNRRYEIEQAEKIINKFRKEFPDITLSTDIIAGYPGEKEEDHKKNLEFIRKFKPDVFNLSKFSKHKRTAAEKMQEISIKIINKRTSELMQLHRKTAFESKQKFKNSKIKVFVNKKTNIPNLYEARDENYNIILVKASDKIDKSILGKNINVIIKQTGVHHMIGEIV